MKASIRSLAGLLGIALVLTAAWAMTRAPAAEVQPNIVFVLFDDADKRSVEKMPKIDKHVTDRGVRFDRFYATTPLCCPSRASFLTGEYVHNHGVANNFGADGGHDRFVERGHDPRSIAVALSDAGYRTALFGKYLNEYNETPEHVPPGWTRWFAKLGAGYYDYDVNDGGQIVHFGRKRQDYATNVVTRRARDWIGDQATSGGPFFAFVSVSAPHRPLVDPPQYTDEYANAPLPAASKPSFNEQDVSDKPKYIRKREQLTPAQRSDMTSTYRHKLRMMRPVDDFVGRIVKDLGELDQLDNTYIVVSSDNGWMQGEHRLPEKKTVPYEESARLPLLVRGPGVESGGVRKQLTSMMDLFGTFTDIGGDPVLRDGRSLVPLLAEGAAPAWRTQLLIEYLAEHDRGLPRYFGVVEPRFKYVRYRTNEEELYDLASDRFETSSLHKSSSQAARKAQLGSKLDALSTCEGDSCRTADGGP